MLIEWPHIETWRVVLDHVASLSSFSWKRTLLARFRQAGVRADDVLRVDDVFQTLNIDSQPRTRGLPGTGHRPTPLIELLRQGSEDSRSLLQLAAVGSGEDGQGTGAASELMLNSGKTAGKTMRYSMESMGCQMNTADAERMEGQLQAIGFQKADDPKDAQVLVLTLTLT